MKIPRSDLKPGEVHLWYVLDEPIVEPELLGSYHALLDAEERARHDRFVFARHSHQFLVSHALTRTVLSRYAEVRPDAWRFRTNGYGRPEISEPAAPPLRFNLSHTDGMAVCAVTLASDVGCDVEDLERAGETVSLAETCFSPAEVKALRALPPADQRERFFAYWTLKEAYIKARGMGLSLPLDQFSLVLAPGAPIRIELASSLGDDADRWTFAQIRVTPRYLIACAVRETEASPPRVWRTVPLID